MKKIISEIWIYPVKSLGGIRLKSAKVFPKGLWLDRRWMLIDAENRFMTQRTIPQLALFKLSFDREGILIRYQSESIFLPLDPIGALLTAQVWDDIVEVCEVSKDHSQWFSVMLGIQCRLVAFPENNIRDIDKRYAFDNEQVSLADGYPLLIIGQSSLDNLNARLEIPLPMNRFRPNLVFINGAPYEEDHWKNFSAGDCRFTAVKPCSRCVITTVDQDTGKKGAEPLVTLATFRRKDNKVYFGQNLIPLSLGEIREGDEIFQD